MSHFLASDGSEYALRNCNDSNMVGITISNEVNVLDKNRNQPQKKGQDNLKCDMVSFRESSPVEF